ncbi:glutamate-5-semialdehyde dehydrogenase [Cytobacillus kochii]|uniref:glutamate-5-semialdehyde dehydrogenase n=1 Tax=Cytobacillus kochii TaxID=859143 RepID=UPI00203F738C|nr:glutamate-5-semialdehyde dehydrogenase [Cytobacillus kochii]MCM3321460.1 glutamate-5-semialdehyde dehydrogenase [Cytobacillus kochii]MCM3343706.1 glutamate-5-semialdehyde dehydrogenase [Cytobacillus kochii]
MTSEVYEKGKLAKKASYRLSGATTAEKNQALNAIANQLIEDQEEIRLANEKDIRMARGHMSDSMIDRLMLDESRIRAMAQAVTDIAQLDDPIHRVLQTIKKENGLLIQQKSVPLGVIGMIYEARPNVTIDAASLALKTNNCVILRGSKTALHSNRALVQTVHRALQSTELPIDSVLLIEDTSREAAKELFHLHTFLDVLIPRGGKGLIDTVVREASVPVIETGAGNCHMYIDEFAELEMAKKVVLNAKKQRPSVCNSIESLLIHTHWLEKYGGEFLAYMENEGIEMVGDQYVKDFLPHIELATTEDFHSEFLCLKMSVKTVASVEDAITHIRQYGTKHSEAIITENNSRAETFMNHVDAAAVYHNASTRFTDGFEFGFGAEIGISTQKMHVRGPLGLKALTSSKYFIEGNGQIRE